MVRGQECLAYGRNGGYGGTEELSPSSVPLLTSSPHGVEHAGVLHLLPRLIAPFHRDRGIGIRSVACRIVVPGGRQDARALRDGDRLLEHVVRLPVEVVLRNREERPLCAVG